MKKYRVLTAILLAVGFFMALPVFAAINNPDYSASIPSTANEIAGSAMGQLQNSGQFQGDFNTKDLVGKIVKDNQGQTVGKVENIVIGNNGMANFVVLRSGPDQKYIAVPFKTFISRTTNLKTLMSDTEVIANLDKSKLESAPAFENMNWATIKNSQDKICNYFGPEQCAKG